MDSNALSLALARLRPVCMEIVQTPNARNLEDFMSEVMAVDPNVMHELQQFVMFPLRCTFQHCLSKTMPQQVLVNACQAVVAILSKSTLHNPSIFMDFLGLLSDMFFRVSSVDGKRKEKLSEEEMMSLLDAVNKLLTSADDSIKRQLFALNNLPLLGSLVSQMVSLVPDTKNGRDLQLKAMQGLRTLMQKDSQVGTDQPAWQLGSRFAGLLPGISTAMLKAVMGDTKQGHHVFCTALCIWTDVVCLTMGDSSLIEEQQTNQVWLDKAEMDEKLRSLIVERTKEWVNSVIPRVDFMLKELAKLKKHDSWKVRQTLAELADRLLIECHGSLQTCVPTILEILVSLMADEYVQVSELAINALKNFQERQKGNDNCRKLEEMLEEGLLVLTTSLARRIKMEDEEEKVALINLLNGYISILGNQASFLFLSLPHMSRLAQVLAQVMELDCSDQKILEETGMGAAGDRTDQSKFVDRVNVMKPHKKFVHFHSDKVKAGLMKTCHLLGQHGNLTLLVDSFLEVYRQNSAHRLVCVLIINEIVAGSTEVSGGQSVNKPSDSNKINLIRMLMEEYLSPANMILCETVDLSLKANEHLSRPMSLYVMEEASEKDSFTLTKNKAIFLTCLYLEGVGIFAKALDRDFRFLLMDILYILAEKVGSEMSSVSSTAYLALVDVSCACGYSLDKLIQENADYLVNSVSLRLRHFHQNHRAPTVLSVMLQFCGTNILPLVWDSIVEILETLDENYEDQAVLFLRVLHHLMLAIGRWYPSQPKQPRRTHCIIEKLDPERLVATLLQRHQQRLAADNFDDESTAEGNDLDEEAAVKMAAEDERRKEEKNEEKEVPQHIKAVKEVLQRAKNLLGLQAPRMAMLALDIITQGCANLMDHENELLPMIHQVWDPFKQRFCEQNRLVVIKAVKSLHKMCSLCGDFIRKRVEKDILPTLLPFLLKQAGTSFGSGVAYQHTLNFKLQNTLLTTLGDIAYMVELDDVVLEKVIDSCLPYLSQHQPQKLQEACVTCMKQLALCNVDLLWFRLSGLYTPSVPEPPSQHFLPVKVFNPMISNEYSKNVNLLMCYLDSVNGQSTTEGMR